MTIHQSEVLSGLEANKEVERGGQDKRLPGGQLSEPEPGTGDEKKTKCAELLKEPMRQVNLNQDEA